MKTRRIDYDKEPIKNCISCDETSTSIYCSDMIEVTFDNENQIYICLECADRLKSVMHYDPYPDFKKEAKKRGLIE